MFKKATKEQMKLKIALTGVSGAGKTMSALRLASGIGKRIAVIDTEKSAKDYSDKFNFDVEELTDHSIDAYIKSINDAVNSNNYDVLIIDTISHAWIKLLEDKEKLDGMGKGNSYTNWAKMTPRQRKFIDTILFCNIDTIVTMRSKHAYALQDNGGKQVVKKMGLEPIQRSDIEYEFKVVFDIAINNEAEASKDRTGLFKGRNFLITEETGKELVAWRNSGEPKKEVIQPMPAETPNKDFEVMAITKEIKKLIKQHRPSLKTLAEVNEWFFKWRELKFEKDDNISSGDKLLGADDLKDTLVGLIETFNVTGAEHLKGDL